MSRLVHSNVSERFAGKIVREKTSPHNRLKLASDNYFRTFINTRCKPGDQVTVVVTNKRPKRTIAQNNYYWGVYLPLIKEKTGEEDSEKLHELFKGMFLTRTIAEVMGQKVRITKSTTDLSVSDFCEYILAIEEFTEVQAPPTENYDLAPLRKPLTPVKQGRV